MAHDAMISRSRVHHTMDRVKAAKQVYEEPTLRQVDGLLDLSAHWPPALLDSEMKRLSDERTYGLWHALCCLEQQLIETTPE